MSARYDQIKSRIASELIAAGWDPFQAVDMARSIALLACSESFVGYDLRKATVARDALNRLIVEAGAAK